MSKGYEERYLMILLSSVMNQKSAPEPLRQLNWEKLFRLSDYHHVAHAVYYGIMGINEEIPQTIRKRFFDKYLEAVHRTERLRAGEKEVRYLLERGKVNCFIMNYVDIVSCYPIEEMCCLESIEIGTDKKSMKKVQEILENADFEKIKTEERGCIYYRVPGVRILCYDHSLFFSRSMKNYYKSLLSVLPFKRGCKYVREMTMNDKHLFLMCRLTDCYARGEISLNQIMDFWAFYRKFAESLNWPYISDKLKKMKIEEFSERLENLIIRWFGTGADIENAEIYDAMESYILTKGIEGRSISSKFLPLIKTVADCYARNRKAEMLKKLIKWTFPDRRYMETIYPSLGLLSFLLPVFWVMRLFRYLRRYIFHEIKERVKTMEIEKKDINTIEEKEVTEETEEKEETEQEEATEIP